MINKDNIKNLIPKTPQINGREEYIKTSVLVLLLKTEDDWNIVFEKRAKNISQGGEISFAGGKFDENLDKTAQDTAVREAVEELGIKPEDIDVIGELDTLIAPIGAMIKPFLAISNISEDSIKPNIDEVEYVFSVPLNWFFKNKPMEYHTVLKAHPTIEDKDGNTINLLHAKELGLPKRYHQPWGRLKQKVYVYEYNNEVIWGLTAKIVNSLIKSLAQYIK